MRIQFAAFAVAATALVAALPATAQQKAPVYRYCLFENSVRGAEGIILCRFNTLAQCMASRNGFADTCIINPYLASRR